MGRKDRKRGASAYRTDAELRVSGRWCGGTVKVRDGQVRSPKFRLRPQVFAVLVVLMMRGKIDESAEGHEDDIDWQNHGYLTAAEIANLATRMGHVKVTKRQVRKLIHELRQNLAELWNDRRKGTEWAWRLVEWQANLGYRLSTHPKNLYLHLILDLSRCDTIPLSVVDGEIRLGELGRS